MSATSAVASAPAAMNARAAGPPSGALTVMTPFGPCDSRPSVTRVVGSALERAKRRRAITGLPASTPKPWPSTLGAASSSGSVIAASTSVGMKSCSPVAVGSRHSIRTSKPQPPPAGGGFHFVAIARSIPLGDEPTST